MNNINFKGIEETLIHYFAAAGHGYDYIKHLIQVTPGLSELSYEEAVMKIYEVECGHLKD